MGDLQLILHLDRKMTPKAISIVSSSLRFTKMPNEKIKNLEHRISLVGVKSQDPETGTSARQWTHLSPFCSLSTEQGRRLDMFCLSIFKSSPEIPT